MFGGIYSPSCSNYALKKTAADNAKKFENEASRIIKRNFCVDNMQSRAFQMSDESNALRRWIRI